MKRRGRNSLIEIMAGSSRWSSTRSKLIAEIRLGERSTWLDLRTLEVLHSTHWTICTISQSAGSYWNRLRRTETLELRLGNARSNLIRILITTWLTGSRGKSQLCQDMRFTIRRRSIKPLLTLRGDPQGTILICSSSCPTPPLNWCNHTTSNRDKVSARHMSLKIIISRSQATLQPLYFNKRWLSTNL